MISSSPACRIEVPERLTVSHQALIKCGLADRCVAVPVRQATDEEILLVHRSDFSTPNLAQVPFKSNLPSRLLNGLCFPDSEEYLEAVKKTPYMTLEDLQMFTLQYGDVYFHPVGSQRQRLIQKVYCYKGFIYPFFPSITEHLPLCQAGCRGGPAARGQRYDREGEERHGSGQVRHMRCVRDSWIQQPINSQLKLYTNLKP